MLWPCGRHQGPDVPVKNVVLWILETEFQQSSFSKSFSFHLKKKKKKKKKEFKNDKRRYSGKMNLKRIFNI